MSIFTIDALNTSKGADIASAATTDIWIATDAQGNYRDITGVVAITSFGTAPKAGAFRILQFDGILTLTNGANLIVPGGTRITAAGDVCMVVADTTTQHRIAWYQRADGLFLVDGWANSGAIDLTSGSPTAVSLVSSLVDVSEIEIIIIDFSTDSNDTGLILQIGDSGGLETSGYTGRGSSVSTTVTGGTANSDGFNMGGVGEFDVATLTDLAIQLGHMGSNIWSSSSHGSSNLPIVLDGVGIKTLTGALDRVTLTTSGGTAVFDSGTAYVRSR